jgi:hypothetical protein
MIDLGLPVVLATDFNRLADRFDADGALLAATQMKMTAAGRSSPSMPRTASAGNQIGCSNG